MRLARTRTTAIALSLSAPSPLLPGPKQEWRPEFLWAVGEPRGACYRASATVFTRAWTYGNVTLDCSSFHGTIPTA